MIALAYKRSDHGEDPAEWRVEGEDERHNAATTAYHLLEKMAIIPGTKADGSTCVDDLLTWIREVRELCTKHDRVDIGDQKLGLLLSKAPREENGTWPCQAVCEVMEAIASEHLARGFKVGVYNARGAVWRGPGGDQERDLADIYRQWAKQIGFDYPFMGRILDEIADTYDREGEWHDTDEKVRRRLRH
jgi:hypothetical protein